jgi:alanine racemase
MELKNMNNIYRPTKIIVDSDAIQKNINNIKQFIGPDITLMPVIKANGYGSYINYDKKFLYQFDYVSVALVSEAIQIRLIGFTKSILVLNPIVNNEIEYIIKYNLTINGCNLNTLKKISKTAKIPITIHLELETGMGRTGISTNELGHYIDEIKKLKNIYFEGVFSHLSSSSKDIEYSKKQIDEFEKGIAIIKKNDIKLKYIHLCNSGAIMNFSNKLYNMVRIGIMIYGYYPNKELRDKIKLYPSMILKTRINFLKQVQKGFCVGYNKNFIAKRETKVATIPFGFADGLIGLETGNPYVIINNKKAKIIGICMDNMMIDVTDIDNVDLGTEVFIWDNDNLTVEEVADWCNGICNYEIISSVSDRVPRIIINKKQCRR